MSRASRVAATLLVLVLPSLGVRVIGLSSFADEKPISQAASDWQRLALRDEEFSILTPVQPSILIQTAGYILSKDGERVLDQRAYSGYADGFVFVIESYKASRPQRLLKDIRNRLGNVRLEPVERVKINEFDGEKYRIGRNDFVGYMYSFATSQHVYMLTVAAKDSNHPSLGRFISSFTLGDTQGFQGNVLPKREDYSVVSGRSSGSPVTSKDATLKAIIVWKPEPAYTEAARYNQTTGKVVVRAIFTSSGQIVVGDVIKGGKDGLTEKTIEAVKNIKFFPAEKDGQPISLTLQLEYNFRLY